MNTNKSRLIALTGTVALVGLICGAAVAPAQAAFPGGKGRIAFDSDRDAPARSSTSTR
jgi:hypothetical protein